MQFIDVSLKRMQRVMSTAVKPGISPENPCAGSSFFSRQPAGWRLYLVSFFVAVMPLAINGLCVFFLFDSSVQDIVPVSTDAFDYWHEVYSVVSNGLVTGYYGFQESYAPVLGFGAHGAWYPMMMGVLGKIFGWELYSIPVFQAIFLFATIFYVGLRSRLNVLQILLLVGFFSAYPPLVKNVSLSMQETLHHAIAILLACLSWRMAENEVASIQDRRGTLLFVALLCFAILMRYTWAVALLPFCWILLKNRKYPVARCVVVLLLALPFFYYFTYSLFRSTFSHQTVFHSAVATVSKGKFPTELFTAPVNFLIYASTPHGKDHFAGDALLSAVFLLASSLVPLAAVARCFIPRLKGEGRVSVAITYGIFPFSLYLGSAYAYAASGILDEYYRTITPLAVFVFVYFVLWLRSRYLLAVVVTCVFSIPAYMMNIEPSSFGLDSNNAIRSRISAFQSAVAPFLGFQKNASPWCNTVSIVEPQPAILGLPAGVAYNVLGYHSDPVFPLKSRYVLLPKGAAFGRYREHGGLQLLTSTPDGDLYLNTMSACLGCSVSER